MKASDLVTIAVVAAGAYGAYRAIQAGMSAADTVGGWLSSAGDTVAGAYDAVTGVLSSGVDYVAAVPDKIVTAVHGPAVPVGGSSVQLRHTTDLPEGSYKAADMYWSLYPNAVFYD